MNIEEMKFTNHENSLWQKIGERFGCGMLEAIRWFVDGAPITLIGGRRPYANMSALEKWLQQKYSIPTEKRMEALKEIAKKALLGTPPFTA